MANDPAVVHPRSVVGSGQRIALLGLFGVAAVLIAVAGASALWPEAAAEQRWFRAGHIEDFAPGTMTTFELQDAAATGLDLIHVARLEDGTILAISGNDSHPRGCDVRWSTDFWLGGVQGSLRERCVGTTYDEQGRRLFGPAPRDLDRLAFEVTDDGTLRIDVSHTIEPPLTGWP